MEIISYAVAPDFWRYTKCLCQPRWGLYGSIIKDIADDETVIVCDTNDIMFQNSYYDSSILRDNDIYCGYEGMQYKDNSCCYNWFEPENKLKYRNDDVKCAGCLVMTAKTMKKLTPLMAHIQKTYCDQNLLQVVADEYKFNMIDSPQIASMTPNNNYQINGYGKVVKQDDIPTSILHFNGANANPKVMEQLLSLYSTERCLDTQTTILNTIS